MAKTNKTEVSRLAATGTPTGNELFEEWLRAPEIVAELAKLDSDSQEKMKKTLQAMAATGLPDDRFSIVGPQRIPPVWEFTLDEPLCREFLSQASEFLRIEPWHQQDHPLIFEIDCHQVEGGPWFAVVLGQNQELAGISFYRDFDQLISALDESAEFMEVTGDTMLFSFDHSTDDDYHEADFDKAVAAGWNPDARLCLPSLFRIGEEGSPRPVTEDEFTFCTMGISVINWFTQFGLGEALQEYRIGDKSFTVEVTIYEPQEGEAVNAEALTALQDSLELSLEDWPRFCELMCRGFGEYERERFCYQGPMTPDEIPIEWLCQPGAFGFVVGHILRKGRKSIKHPVACHYLSMIHAALEDKVSLHSFPYAAKTFLYLENDAEHGSLSDLEMLELAKCYPTSALQGLNVKEVCELFRVLLVSRGEVKYWHLCDVLFIAARSQVFQSLQILKIYDSLIAQPYIPDSELAGFAHALIGRDAEHARVIEFMESHPGKFAVNGAHENSFGYFGDHLHHLTLQSRGLKRRAVKLLAKVEGDPLKLASQLLKFQKSEDPYDFEMLRLGAIDVLDQYAQDIGLDQVERLLKSVIQKAPFGIRHAAYRVGLKRFGKTFIRGALSDESGKVRKWAQKRLT